MSDVSKITPQQLPKLIAAAVERALAQHPITPEQLANFSKIPIRCGIYPVEPVLAHEKAAPAAAAPVLGHRPLPFGFVLRDFNLLVDPLRVEPFTGAEKEQ